MQALQQRGIGTLIHFPIPLHLQPAFAFLGGKRGDLPVVEQASDEILSLPLYPELEDEAAATRGRGRPRRGPGVLASPTV